MACPMLPVSADGPAPAIVNAIRHIGLDLREIPAVPERVMTAARAGGAA